MSYDTAESKLEALAGCGFHLNPGFSSVDFIENAERKYLEEPGFKSTLISLGLSQEEEPWRPPCDNLWYGDTECIEDQGAYVQLVQRLAEMTQGSLPISDIRDEIDFERNKARVEFVCRGKTVRWKLKVVDDWVDARLFSWFADLLRRYDPNKSFVVLDLQGQDFVLACIVRDQIPGLRGLEPNFKLF